MQARRVVHPPHNLAVDLLDLVRDTGKLARQLVELK